MELGLDLGLLIRCARNVDQEEKGHQTSGGLEFETASLCRQGAAPNSNHRIAIGVFDRRQNMSLISTSDGKRLRANTHTGGRRRNSLRLLLPHHSMRGDERGD